jgi:murein DD-endopeptidase MepM/ murein hydrolase activator NlpD
MKTPIDGARLSSHFGKRKHPVLGYVRNHPGTDFAAPTGTPIYAAGDGIVERASRYGSYGNYIRIRHNGTYKTAYAHLSKYGRGIKKGKRVKQGQIIGYVGATGRVTGAHLHYEVLQNDKRVNPLSLKLPSGRDLKGDLLKQFLIERNILDTQLPGSQSALDFERHLGQHGAD